MSTGVIAETTGKIRKKKTPPEKVYGYSLKLPLDVIESVRIVTTFRNETAAELLGTILRPILAKMEREEVTKWMQSRKDGE